MPSVLKGSLAVAGGLVAWTVVATALNLVLRRVSPDYAAVEKAMEFTVAMLIARLIVGAASSIAAGVACHFLCRPKSWPSYVAGVVLLAGFVPVHIGLWSKFPVWYHLLFLGSLLPLAVLGAAFASSRRRSAA